MDTEIHEFSGEVDEFVEETARDAYPCLATLKKIKLKKIALNGRLTDLVEHFNCTTSMVKDPKPKFEI